MSHSKADQFGSSLFHQSFWSRALSHPARIIIMQYLLNMVNPPSKIFEKKFSFPSLPFHNTSGTSYPWVLLYLNPNSHTPYILSTQKFVIRL